jgi:hypothetical protein
VLAMTLAVKVDAHVVCLWIVQLQLSAGTPIRCF